jgi:hypothetical protein
MGAMSTSLEIYHPLDPAIHDDGSARGAFFWVFLGPSKGKKKKKKKKKKTPQPPPDSSDSSSSSKHHSPPPPQLKKKETVQTTAARWLPFPSPSPTND